MAARLDLAVAVALGAAAVVVYFPLVVQGRVLASFDTLVYFYPNAAYLASRLGAGQLPLWDPYLFAGVPFLANSQVGVLYPLHWLYLLAPVSRVYAGLVVLHAWLVGCGVFVLACRSLGLRLLPAVFAAL